MVRNVSKDRRNRQLESLARSVEGFSKPVGEPSEGDDPTTGTGRAEPPAASAKPERRAKTAGKGGKGSEAGAKTGKAYGRRTITLQSNVVYRPFTNRLTSDNMKAVRMAAAERDTTIQAILNALVEEGLRQGGCDLHTADQFVER